MLLRLTTHRQVGPDQAEALVGFLEPQILCYILQDFSYFLIAQVPVGRPDYKLKKPEI